LDNPFFPQQKEEKVEEELFPEELPQQRKRNFASIIALIIVIAVVVSGGFFIYKQKKAATSSNKTAVTLATAAPGDFDAMIKSQYATAKEKAVAVNPKFQLSAIEIQLPPTLEKNSGTSRYIFSSPDDATNNWTIAISNENNEYMRALIPKDDYFGELTPINTTLWKFNHVTALQIAEKNGGESFRKNNNLSSVRITLRHLLSAEALYWIVEYKGGSSIFRIQIDASTGNIIESQ